MQKYEGLVVGGPMDGQMLAHWDTIYPLHPAPSVPASLAELQRIDLKPEAPPPFNYYFSSSIYHHGSETRDISFWLPKDMTILDAFDAVRARYQEPNKTKVILLKLYRIAAKLARYIPPASFRTDPDFSALQDVLHEARGHLEDDL